MSFAPDHAFLRHNAVRAQGRSPLASWIGALVPTGILTFVLLWFLQRLKASRPARVLLANAGSLTIATVLAAFGLAYDGAPKFAEAAVGYAVPQILWLAISALIFGRAARAAAGSLEHRPRLPLRPVVRSNRSA
jgi:hypothetical protein